MGVSINLPLLLGLIPQLIFILIIDNILTSAQNCQRIVAKPHFNYSCPFFTREAFTIETSSPFGGPLYQKECCDSKGVEWSQAAVKGCIATPCAPYSSSKSCSSVPRYIVNSQLVTYEEVRRDQCTDPGSGQSAVCCPPNSQANLLISKYGAEQNEFPHQARVETEDQVCGGTVYSRNFVITSAHCVIDKQGYVKNPRTIKLVLGTNIASYEGDSVYPVDTIIFHPGYSLHRGNSEYHSFPRNRRMYNDIALLRLGKDIQFSRNIKALPVAPENFNPGQHGSHVTSVGWGTIDNGITSKYLIKANLLVRGDDQCFKGAFGGLPYPNTKDFLGQLHCFGGVLNGEYSPMAEKGDSGGPAICKGPGGYAVLCGVKSFGDLEGVYADVSYFRSWIRSIAGPQDGGTLLKKVIFGDYKSWNDYPHQVKVTSYEGPTCGGTLISRDTVITAGHCAFVNGKCCKEGLKIITWDGRQYEPRWKGVLAPSNYANYGIINGLKFSSLQGPTWIDNLALIRLMGEVPISFGNLPSLPGSWFTASVSQLTHVMELAWPEGKMGNDLIQRNFKILPNNECQRRLERLGNMGIHTNLGEMDKFFCGVEEYSGGGVCDRHLGGGVICPGGGGAGVLCGVQTFRFCEMSLPTVFVNMGAYSDVFGRYIG